MMKTVETVVTFLEMDAQPVHHFPPPSNLKIMLMRAEKPNAGFYRYLYDAVGGNYAWVDRKRMSDEKLLAAIHAPGVEIWVLYAAGAPAGFFELGPAADGAVELIYFGLIADFHGAGLGKWFLAEAIRAGWAMKPSKLVVETCTLDGPAALPLYQRLGFRPVGQKAKVMELLD
jgi:GNAT superfamily N-acetyltransferase